MTEQSQLGPSNDGSVVLDIGGDIGALILHAPESLAGVEIEISPVGSTGHRSHVAIRERRGESGVRYAAIYPDLHAGDYTVFDQDGQPAETVSIVGGQIAHIDWRSHPPG